MVVGKLAASPLRRIPVPFTVGRFVKATTPLVIVTSTPERLRLSILFKSIALKMPVPET